MEVAVYVVDKQTGLQARLYQGSPYEISNEGQEFYMNTHHFHDNFGVSTFFSSGNFGIIPATRGNLLRGRMPAVFQLNFMWEYGWDDYRRPCVRVSDDEFLAFFEKGLSWDMYPRGHRRIHTFVEE